MQFSTRALGILGFLALVLLPVFWLWNSPASPGLGPAPHEAGEFSQQDLNGTELGGKQAGRQAAEDAAATDAESAKEEQPQRLVDVTITISEELTGAALPNVPVLFDEIETVSDAAGQVRVQIAAGRYYLSVDPPEGNLQEASGGITIPPVEEKEVKIVLRPKANLSFFGRLLTDGKPVAGAKLEMYIDEQLRETIHSAADGSFSVIGDREEGYVKLVEAGYSPLIIAIVTGHESHADALEIPLQAAAQLTARIDFADGRPAGSAELILQHQNRQIAFPTGLHRGPFILNYSAEASAEGLARIENLPVDTPLSLRIKYAGRLYLTQRRPIFLKAGINSQSFELPLGQGITGRLIDQTGQGIAGIEIGAMPHDGEATVLMPAWRMTRDQPTTISDEDGGFAIPDLPAGSWLIGVVRRPGETGLPCTATCVQLELSAGIEAAPVEVRAWTGVFISGRALTPEQDPVVNTVIFAQRVDGDFGSSARTLADGSFSLGPLLPGDYEITSEVFGSRFGLTAPVRSMAPEDDLQLMLVETAGTISGQVQSPSDRSGRMAWIMLYHRGSDSSLGRRSDLARTSGSLCRHRDHARTGNQELTGWLGDGRGTVDSSPPRGQRRDLRYSARRSHLLRGTARPSRDHR
ncbi:MAG: MSCRAMM family protein [Planctomycetota bacterium]